jgi:hypothetical protein
LEYDTLKEMESSESSAMVPQPMLERDEIASAEVAKQYVIATLQHPPQSHPTHRNV